MPVEIDPELREKIETEAHAKELDGSAPLYFSDYRVLSMHRQNRPRLDPKENAERQCRKLFFVHVAVAFVLSFFGRFYYCSRSGSVARGWRIGPQLPTNSTPSSRCPQHADATGRID